MKSLCLTRLHPYRRQAGVTIIEVMVTLLILAIGLLGLAAMQGFTLQSGQNAYYRTQATNAAYFVADFVRMNRSAFKRDCPTKGISGILDADALDQLVARLPGGAVEVEIAGCTENQISIQVSWEEDRLQDTNDERHVRLVTWI